MSRFRLSRLAEADLAQILRTSEARWGREGRRRYAAILAVAMRKAAAEPEGPPSRNRAKVSRGIRSFHVRHARGGELEAKVRRPVHILYYRVAAPDVIEIIRVLHERMEPGRHVEAALEDKD